MPQDAGLEGAGRANGGLEMQNDLLAQRGREMRVRLAAVVAVVAPYWSPRIYAWFTCTGPRLWCSLHARSAPNENAAHCSRRPCRSALVRLHGYLAHEKTHPP